MNILVPMAARSDFFPATDFPFPKPLIEVNGIPMIERVVENLGSLGSDTRFIFVVEQADIAVFSLDNILRLVTDGNCEIVALKAPTKGALCSCLLAIDYIEADRPLAVVNDDQLLHCNLRDAVDLFESSRADAGVICFPSVHPRWSYVKLDHDGHVIQAEEKKVISKNGVAGFYYFRTGKVFLDAAMETIEMDRSVNGVFYTAPSLNSIVLAGGKVCACHIAEGQYSSFYSPAKISEFEAQENQTGFDSRGYRKSADANSGDFRCNVVIPAAGEGTRFVDAGFSTPKPFLPVMGTPMVELVMQNVSMANANFVLLLRKQHMESAQEQVGDIVSFPNTSVLPVEKLTEGTACTVLLARSIIDKREPLLIANSDQLVDFNCQRFVDDCNGRGLDGSILVFKDRDMNPKWSFAKVDENGFVTEVAEKVPISNLATVGIYYFRRGRDFVEAALDMIVENDRVNGEFYTCPVYNYMIRNGKKIGVFEVKSEAMHGLGTPEDLETYIDSRNS